MLAFFKFSSNYRQNANKQQTEHHELMKTVNFSLTSRYSSFLQQTNLRIYHTESEILVNSNAADPLSNCSTYHLV